MADILKILRKTWLMGRRGQTSEWADYVAKLGDNLQRIRHERGMSQEQVAYRAGMSRFTYQRMERSNFASASPANPTLVTLVSLCKVLEVPLQALLPDGPLPDPGDLGIEPSRRRMR